MLNQNIYEQMSRQRLEVVSTQIDFLYYYDPEGKERRMEESYDVFHQSIIDEQSEKSLEDMEGLIRKYEGEISFYRKEKPEVENSEDVKRKINELERLYSFYGF